MTKADDKRLSRILDCYVEAADECEAAMKTATLAYAQREAIAELLVAFARAVNAPKKTQRILAALVADDDDRVVH